MRPFDIYDSDQLRQARARSEELRESWRAANYRRPATGGKPDGPRFGILRATRAAAGRGMIRFGQRVLPAGTEPCM
jgi:hypothetical protein